MRNVFITGATGFLGSNLLKVITAEKESRLYVLVRNPKLKLPKEIFRRINIIKGDVSKNNLGINKKDYRMLQDNVDTIYHCAAIREFGYGIDTIRKVNVKGTQNLLKMALDWRDEGHLKNVNHISTVYIAGDYNHTFYEKQLDVSQRFNNAYEQSKFEAEIAVQKYREKGLPVDVYRPSIIAETIPVTGKAIYGLLHMLNAFILEIFQKIPADENAKLNLIPVNYVSKAIYLISAAKEKPVNQTYHITNPQPVKLGSLLDVASCVFKFKKPECVPFKKFNMRDLTFLQRRIIEPSIPYLNQKLSFDMHNTLSILKKYNFKIPPIDEKLLFRVFNYYKSAGVVSKRSGYAFKR